MPVLLVQSDIWKSVAYPALILTGVCLMMIEQRESMSVASTTYARNESHFHGLARKNESLEPILQNDIIFPTLMDEYRTLWTAGWNARHTQYYLGVPPKVTWTPEAEDIVEREYRRLHFPADCSNVRGWLVVNAYEWGLMSAVRDYQSDILRALAINYTVVHQGQYKMCPSNPQRYLDCFWEDLNGCQPEFSALTEIPRINQPQEVTTSAVTQEQFPHWLWDALVKKGTVHLQHGLTGATLEEKDVTDEDQYLQLKLSVLRGILTKRIFKPREHIQQKTLAMLESWRSNATYTTAFGKGVVIHIRRTDKMIDLGAHWRYIDFESTAHLGRLIQTMEGMTNRSFGHYFVMSDDPHMQKRGSEELASYFHGNPSKLVSSELCDLLGANQLEYSGHASLEAVQRHQLYGIVVAEIYAAVEVSQYIIGSGSCAVSQFMALNIGARQRVEPGLVALWEEDIIIKECRWILNQRVRLHKPCRLVSLYSDQRSMEIVIQNLLDRQWTDKGCPQFLPPLPACLDEPEFPPPT